MPSRAAHLKLGLGVAYPRTCLHCGSLRLRSAANLRVSGASVLTGSCQLTSRRSANVPPHSGLGVGTFGSYGAFRAAAMCQGCAPSRPAIGPQLPGTAVHRRPAAEFPAGQPGWQAPSRLRLGQAPAARNPGPPHPGAEPETRRSWRAPKPRAPSHSRSAVWRMFARRPPRRHAAAASGAWPRSADASGTADGTGPATEWPGPNGLRLLCSGVQR
jgi:hypothetical protein